MGTLVLSGYLENQKTDPAQEFDLNLGKLAATLDFFPPTASIGHLLLVEFQLESSFQPSGEAKWLFFWEP